MRVAGQQNMLESKNNNLCLSEAKSKPLIAAAMIG
jgi:hypothetical protein